MGKPRRPGRGPAGRVLAGLLVVLGIAAAGGSRLLHSSDVEAARAAAEDRAVEYADAVIAPLLSPSLVAKPILGADQVDLLAAIGRSIRSDGVARVRLWSSSGQLLFSSDKLDTIGSKSGPEVRAASKGSGTIASGEELDDVGKSGEPLYRTLVPMRLGSDPSAAITQVDQRLAPIDDAAREPAGTVQVAGIASASLGVLLLLVWVLRGRTGRGKAGGFQPVSSEPRVALDPSVLEARLEKAELARDAVEQQLEQLRTQITPGGPRDAERTKALEGHLRETEERARELEIRLRSADDRLLESDRVAKQAVVRAEEAEARAAAAAAASPGETIADPRVPRLEAELAAVRAELETPRGGNGAPTAAPEELSAELDELRARAERAEGRVTELEEMRSADQQRLAASADVAERSTLRIRELEGKLEGSSHDREAVVSRVRELEAQLADIERRTTAETTAASDAEQRAVAAEQAAAVAEERAVLAEQRHSEMDDRIETLQELVRSAEERAATAGLRGDDLERRLTAVTAELDQAREALLASNGVGDEQARRSDQAEARALEAGRRVAELEAELEAGQSELENVRTRLSMQEAKLEGVLARAREAGVETEQAEAAATEGAARARELEHALRGTTASLDAAKLAADAAEVRAMEAIARADAAEEASLTIRTELEEVRSELAIARARGQTGSSPTRSDEEISSNRVAQERVSVESQTRIAQLEASAAELLERAEGAESRLRQAYTEVETVTAELDAVRGATLDPERDPVDGDERLRAELAGALARAEAAERRQSEMEAELAAVRGIGLRVETEDATDEGPSLRYRLARGAETKKRRTAIDPENSRS